MKKRATLGVNGKVITCTAMEKDIHGKVYWEDENGKQYELIRARNGKCWFVERQK